MNASKILVTGGCGFIGSAVIRSLINSTDYDVVNLDKLTYAGNLDSLPGIINTQRYSDERVDICDGQALARVFEQHQPTWIMHLAAESHVDRSIDGPADFINTNITGTFNLLEATRKYFYGLDEADKKQFRFHHISTDEVYGSVENGSSVETDILLPNSPYSASKAASDLIVRSYVETYGLDARITRCCNNYGPNQYPEKFIPLAIKNLKEGKKLSVYGDGMNIREWIHVEDHCSGLFLAMENGKPGEIYNIGAGNETANRVLVDKLLALLGKDDSSVNYVADRLGHDRRYSVDIAKITALGWKRARSLDEALEQTVAWYRDNRWWWEPLKANK